MTPSTKRRGRSATTEPLDLPELWRRQRAEAAKARHPGHCRGHGWLADAGLDAVLAPLLYGPMYGDESFFRFSALGADAATALLAALPEDYLASERQNDGPTIGTVLRAVVAHPERLLAHGYVIGPGRCDERVTVEGVLLRTEREYRLCELYGPASTDCECDELYRVLADDFGVDDALVHPHELDRFHYYEWTSDGYHGEPWYRAWWD
ncbi:MAG TPA: hypothetical protein PKV13_00565 [Propionicimonas sp.]|nr:hypothetical protein [Propionicimonas sp.]